MGYKPNARRQAVLDRVRSAMVGSDGWTWVPAAGFTVRWSGRIDHPVPGAGHSGPA